MAVVSGGIEIRILVIIVAMLVGGDFCSDSILAIGFPGYDEVVLAVLGSGEVDGVGFSSDFEGGLKDGVGGIRIAGRLLFAAFCGGSCIAMLDHAPWGFEFDFQLGGGSGSS